jgi:hypothetical protein
MASRQLLIPRIAASGTSFSPLPCQAKHGNMVTSAHRVEVEVGADGMRAHPRPGPPPLRRRRAPFCLVYMPHRSSLANSNWVESEIHDGGQLFFGLIDCAATLDFVS